MQFENKLVTSCARGTARFDPGSRSPYTLAEGASTSKIPGITGKIRETSTQTLSLFRTPQSGWMVFGGGKEGRQRGEAERRRKFTAVFVGGFLLVIKVLQNI